MTSLLPTGHRSSNLWNHILHLLLAGVVGLIAIPLGGCARTVPQSNASPTPDAVASGGPNAEVGALAPEISVVTREGGTLHLADLRGKAVLLNFWASWCGPCRGEAPELESLHGTGVTVLGVNQLEDRRAAAKFQQEFALTYPLVLDASGEVSQAYRANGLPVSFLIDEDGVVLHIFRGAVKKADIDAALAEANP